jgi:hypothetical protein
MPKSEAPYYFTITNSQISALVHDLQHLL